jgi:hypothetical protein
MWFCSVDFQETNQPFTQASFFAKYNFDPVTIGEKWVIFSDK